MESKGDSTGKVWADSCVICGNGVATAVSTYAPLLILSCCPAPWTAVPRNTHSHMQARLQKVLFICQRSREGRPLLSWWWLWQHRTLKGRLLRGQYAKAGCMTIIFEFIWEKKWSENFSFSVPREISGGCCVMIHPDHESAARRSSRNWAQNLVTVETPLITGLFCCTATLLTAGLFN